MSMSDGGPVATWESRADAALENAEQAMRLAAALNETQVISISVETHHQGGQSESMLRLRRIDDELRSLRSFMAAVEELLSGQRFERPGEIDSLHNLKSHTETVLALIAVAADTDADAPASGATPDLQGALDAGREALEATRALTFGSTEAFDRWLEAADSLTDADRRRARDRFRDDLRPRLAGARRLTEGAVQALSSLLRYGDDPEYRPVPFRSTQSLPVDGLSDALVHDLCVFATHAAQQLQEVYDDCRRLLDRQEGPEEHLELELDDRLPDDEDAGEQ